MPLSSSTGRRRWRRHSYGLDNAFVVWMVGGSLMASGGCLVSSFSSASTSRTTTTTTSRPSRPTRTGNHLQATPRGRPQDKMDDSEEILWDMEQQVRASAQAQVDYNQVVKLLSTTSIDSSSSTTANSNDDDDTTLSTRTTTNNNESISESLQYTTSPPLPTVSWQIALAASVVSFAMMRFLLQASAWLSGAVAVAIFAVALTDPVEDDSGLVGSLARLVGRQTIQSYQGTIQPKAKAMARAVVTGQDEWKLVQAQLVALQEENAALLQWKRIRLQAEQDLSLYTVEQLKDQCRQRGLPVAKRTKLQLLVQLLEAQEEEKEEAGQDTSARSQG